MAATDGYKERIRYDGNGNILGYLRHGTTADGGALQMDSLTYHYFTGAGGIKRNNRLRAVADAVGSTNYSVDIDNQLASLADAADSNYVYDAIGNLIQDKTENITNIQWSVYGKILAIEKAAVNPVDVTNITYTYDAAGNRIGKRVQYLGQPDQHTWYSRDASPTPFACGSITSMAVHGSASGTGILIWMYRCPKAAPSICWEPVRILSLKEDRSSLS